eukprot:g2830.t1
MEKSTLQALHEALDWVFLAGEGGNITATTTTTKTWLKRIRETGNMLRFRDNQQEMSQEEHETPSVVIESSSSSFSFPLKKLDQGLNTLSKCLDRWIRRQRRTRPEEKEDPTKTQQHSGTTTATSSSSSSSAFWNVLKEWWKEVATKETDPSTPPSSSIYYATRAFPQAQHALVSFLYRVMIESKRGGGGGGKDDVFTAGCRAAQCFMKLLNIRGSQAYGVHNGQSVFVEGVFDCLRPKYRNVQQQQQQTKGEEEEEEEDTDAMNVDRSSSASASSSALRLTFVRGILENIRAVPKRLFHIFMSESTVASLVEAVLSNLTQYSRNQGGTERDRSAFYDELGEVLRRACGDEEGETDAKCAAVLPRLLHILVMTKASKSKGASVLPRQANEARKIALAWSVRLAENSPRAAGALLRRVCEHVPARSEFRKATIATVRKLSTAVHGHSPRIVFDFFRTYLPPYSKSSKAVFRLFAVELIGAIQDDGLFLPPPSASTKKDKKRRRNASVAGDDAPSSPAGFTVERLLVRALLERARDKIPSVRSAALRVLSDMLEKQCRKDEAQEEEKKQKKCGATTARARWANALIPALRGSLAKPHTCTPTKATERRSPATATTTTSGNILQILGNRLHDPNATVKNSALRLVAALPDDVLASLPVDLVRAFAELVGTDRAVSTRKKALQLLTALLLRHPRHEEWQRLWLQFGLPAVHDPESSVQNVCVEAVRRLVVHKIGNALGNSGVSDEEAEAFSFLSKIPLEAGCRPILCLQACLAKAASEARGVGGDGGRASASSGSAARVSKKTFTLFVERALDWATFRIAKAPTSPEDRRRAGVAWASIQAVLESQEVGFASKRTTERVRDAVSAFWALYKYVAASGARRKEDADYRSVVVPSMQRALWTIGRIGVAGSSSASSSRGGSTPGDLAAAALVLKSFAPKLLDRIGKFDVPEETIHHSVETLCATSRHLPSNWQKHLLARCEKALNAYASASKRGEASTTGSEGKKLGPILVTLGEVALAFSFPDTLQHQLRKTTKLKAQTGILFVAKDASKRAVLETLYAPVQRCMVSGGGGDKDDRNDRSPGSLPLNVRALAFVTFGKLCLCDHVLARKYITVLIRELDTTEEPVLRNNVLIILSDLCRQHTALVDPYVGNMAACLMDPHAGVRKHALVLLTELLLQRFVKLRGPILFLLLACMADSVDEIAESARHAVLEIFAKRDPLLLSTHFVETLFVLNGCEGHPKYNRFSRGADGGFLRDERDVFRAFRGSGFDATTKRRSVYEWMLRSMSSENKIRVTARLCQDILGSVVDGVVPLSQHSNVGVGGVDRAKTPVGASRSTPVSSSSSSTAAAGGGSRSDAVDADLGRAHADYFLLDDTFAILCSDAARVRGANDEIDESGGESSSKATDPVAGRAAAIEAAEAVKDNLLSKIARKNALQNVVPMIVSLKKQLERVHSPLVRSVMRYLSHLFRFHRKQVNDALAEDPTIAAEIQYDLRQMDEDERRRAEVEAEERRGNAEAEDGDAENDAARRTPMRTGSCGRRQKKKRGMTTGRKSKKKLPRCPTTSRKDLKRCSEPRVRTDASAGMGDSSSHEAGVDLTSCVRTLDDVLAPLTTNVQ